MPGAVYKVLAKAGEEVKAGEAILILEAMKMEMEVASPVNGTVQSLSLPVGDQVTTGQVLATIRA
jgi:pyruvate carboxylase subunit B